MLKPFYEVFPAPSAAKLFEILEKVLPDLILLDIEMPVMDGYTVIKKLKSDFRFAGIPVIFLTAKNDDYSELEGLDLGAMDYISKPFAAPLLLKRIDNQLLIVRQKKHLLADRASLKDYAENLEAKVLERTAEVFHLQNAVLATIADLVECRDKLTGGHISRTRQYVEVLMHDMARSETYRDELYDWDIDCFLSSIPLHDVGKIAISDLILNKPGKLTLKEFEIMKTHVTVGADAVKTIMQHTNEHAFLNHALAITVSHHEKWDGTGYPNNISGTDIPLEGRLMAIADVYDALISVRPYKKAFSHEDTCKIIEDGSGTHFDPVLVSFFSRAKDEFDKIAQENTDGSGIFYK
ncbi:MAG: response regulator [Planctomycetaceae bacterium]|nr:response regulator [Planctomycetaceae bacterium]